MVLEWLPKHREWASPANQWVRDWAKANSPLALAKLEEIHTEFQARQAVEQARVAVIAAPAVPPVAPPPEPLAASSTEVEGGASAQLSYPPAAGGSTAAPASVTAVPYASLLNALQGGAAPVSASPGYAPAASAPPPYASGEGAAGAARQLRPLRIPARLIDTFRDLAHANSLLGDRGVETCGIVAGRAAGGELVITHLIVPKQRGSADNCEMLDEDALLMYCMEGGLITLGWIHVRGRLREGRR